MCGLINYCFCLMLVFNTAFALGEGGYNASSVKECSDNSTDIKAPTSSDTVVRRARQLQNIFLAYQQYQEESTCLSSLGVPGLCIKSSTCPPLRKHLDPKNSWPSKRSEIVCYLIDSYGNRITGLCCPLNPLPSNSPEKEKTVKISSDSIFANKQDEFNKLNIDRGALHEVGVVKQFIWSPQPSFPVGVPAKWPPPLPTHAPPSQWPPQVPTHPPNHHYPTHPPSSNLPTKPPTTTSSGGLIYPSYRPTVPSYLSTTQRPMDESTLVASKCGKKNGVSIDQERIVGGQNSSPNEWPWIVVLFNKGKQFCGGSLINTVHVLTAAHCVARMTSWDVAGLTAHLGDHNIRTSFEVQHVERKIKRLVRHKGFEFSTLHNDVAVLTLDRPVSFTNEIRPICLPNSSNRKSYIGQVATVVGWGSLRENGPQPSILQKVSIPIWSNIDCARKYGRAAPGGIIDSMLCAGQYARDSCSGDSGGPLMINENGIWTQVGIVSWGIGCGKGQYPGVYTRISEFLPWIMKNLK